MDLETFQVKRPVPQGAKDLGLMDDAYRWRCPQCSLSDETGIERCSCGVFAVDHSLTEKTLTAPARLVVTMKKSDADPPSEVRCSSCVPCGYCGKPLGSEPRKPLEVKDSTGTVRITWYHAACDVQRLHDLEAADQERRRRLEAQLEEERRARAEAEEAARRKQEEEERARQAAMAGQLREEQERNARRQKMEDEKNKRIRNDQCWVCAKPLKMGDKLFGRLEHKACRDKPMRGVF
jgi:hypothetical protein